MASTLAREQLEDLEIIPDVEDEDDEPTNDQELECEYDKCHNAAEWLVKNFCDCPPWVRCNDCLKRMIREGEQRWREAKADMAAGLNLWWRCVDCRVKVRPIEHPIVDVTPIH